MIQSLGVTVQIKIPLCQNIKPFPLYRGRYHALFFLTLHPGPTSLRTEESERQWDSRNRPERA